MKLLKMSLSAMALTFVLTAGPAFAQPFDGLGLSRATSRDRRRHKQPRPAKPPATQPPATQPPANPAIPPPPATPQPPAPFPQGAKIAFVNIQAIAQSSAAGRDASKKLADMNAKKVSEINDKTKQLQAMQAKLKDGAAVLSETARQQLEKDIDKAQRDIQFSQQNAQAEMQELQNDLQGEFQQRLFPVVEAGGGREGAARRVQHRRLRRRLLRSRPGHLRRSDQASGQREAAARADQEMNGLGNRVI